MVVGDCPIASLGSSRHTVWRKSTVDVLCIQTCFKHPENMVVFWAGHEILTPWIVHTSPNNLLSFGLPTIGWFHQRSSWLHILNSTVFFGVFGSKCKHQPTIYHIYQYLPLYSDVKSSLHAGNISISVAEIVFNKHTNRSRSVQQNIRSRKKLVIAK